MTVPSVQVPWTILFLVPTLVPILVLFWLAWMYRRRHPIQHDQNHALIYRCQRCQKVYLDQRRVPLCRCPSCSLLNEPIKR